MKKIILLNINILFCLCLYGQSNLVTLNSGYSHQSFYSLQNGEVLNVENTNWDIAFSTDAFSSSIRINDGQGVQLYTYHLGDTSSWSSINTNSSNTVLDPMYNSDTSWSFGAFDVNQTNGFDYGWGVYNMQTHTVIGDSVFLMQTVDGNWKKLWIESKVGGEYFFKYANLDGSNEVNQNIAADNYSDKRFIYYSLETNDIIDREPNSSAWDITFTKYVTPVQGMPYPVTGILNNHDIEVAQADNIANPLFYSDYTAHNFESEINSIGYDWKSYQGSYVITPNRCYFVRDYNMNIYRLTFTQFDGTSTGNIEFNTAILSASGVTDLNSGSILNIYPNPAINNQDIFFIYDIKSENSLLYIYDLTGKIVYSSRLVSNGLKTHKIPSRILTSGTYITVVEFNGISLTKPLIVK